VGQLGGDLAEFAALWRAGRAAEIGDPVGGPAVDVDRTTASGPRGAEAGEEPVPPSVSRPDPRELPVPPASRPAPRELPPDVLPFTGRADHIAELDRLVAAAGGRSPAVTIATVWGTAGVGKTALAVHWSHRVADRFPDGHLYIDLRGYDPGMPVPPGEALAAFLRALGVPSAEIPRRAAERAARYRSLLAGRRVLVVLDNARSAEQVRPLLPGTPSCFVLVTSRDSLAGLVARHGARRIGLDRLSRVEAAGLMRTLLVARDGDEPWAIDALVQRCAQLPLALRVAAELAAVQTRPTLGDLVRELADGGRCLDLFDAGADPGTSVRAVFSWSYRHLPAAAARAFRLLGLYRGRALDVTAVAALLGVDFPDALRLSDVLTQAHLLERDQRGRFAMHHLLRAYAAGLARQEDGEPERRQALRRLADHHRAVDPAGPPSNRRRPWASPSAEGHAPAWPGTVARTG